jgi:hypothetical protein
MCRDCRRVADRTRHRERRAAAASLRRLTLDQLAASSPSPRWEVKRVLADEVRRGRVTVDRRGGYAITRAAFPPSVLAGLATLGR